MASDLTNRQKKLLREPTELYRKLLRHVSRRRNATLCDIIEACGALTTTNCGWVTYALAPTLVAECRKELAERKNRREAKKRKP